uniref:Uncharacterized protein MANES_01G047100 n=1 Tax=Rhizophora mucronata TaxID=61149 RepID=A0A2P2JHI9_RHIMU
MFAQRVCSTGPRPFLFGQMDVFMSADFSSDSF